MGAAGRDFHNFLRVFRDDAGAEVVAFTAAQIPGIADRRFPAELAGPLYPDGIPIIDEQFLEELIRTRAIDQVVFSYSDISHEALMHEASRVLACGADFMLLGPRHTMLDARLPVIAVSAVRTGCGKSQVARWLASLLRGAGLRPAVIRHPMPYGELARQRVQRFANRDELRAADCTVEEREEFEPHIARGAVVYAGVDYEAILRQAEAECDLIVWDGGNNDYPLLRPDLHIVLLDPLRAGDESRFHPGEATLRMADVALIAKVDVAREEQVARVTENIRRLNPAATVLCGASPVTLDNPAAVEGRRVLVVEDGPTITHGGMPSGAGLLAARRAGAASIVDPHACAAPEIQRVYQAYPHIGPVLPAVGYYARQIEAMRATIAASDAEVVVAGTPIDLGALLTIEQPVVRARYEYADLQSPGLEGVVRDFLLNRGLLARTVTARAMAESPDGEAARGTGDS